MKTARLVSITFRLPEPLKKRLEKFAIKKGEAQVDVVIAALKEFLAREESLQPKGT